MFAKLSVGLTAAFFTIAALMVSGSTAGASESALPIAIALSARGSTALDRPLNIVVAQDDQSGDSADSDSNSDSSDSNDSDDDSQNANSDQNGDQNDQQNAAPQDSDAPDSGAGETEQQPLNSYPQQQVNPNQ